MNIADIIVMIVLGIGVIYAFKNIKRKHCLSCQHCHKNCGGNDYGRKSNKIVKH